MGAVIETVNQTASIPTQYNLIREVGKMDRRRLTDAIQAFIEYVDNAGEGATMPGRAYGNFTRMVYAPLGLNKAQRDARANGEEPSRDMFTDVQLTYIQTLERSAAEVLEAGMEARMARHEIKQEVKDAVWGLGAVYKSLKKLRVKK